MAIEMPISDIVLYSQVPSVAGVISEEQVIETAQSIADLQLDNGMILWFESGHSDPWNHVEAAMALSVAGFYSEAEKAYDWLACAQLPDGSWYNYYLESAVEDYRRDTNVCAYIATGVWHHYLITGDDNFLLKMWESVESALDFVVALQRVDGGVTWSIEPDGTLGKYALLTGSSSIHKSIECGLAIASSLGKEKPQWLRAKSLLARAIASDPYAFEPKERWAMDWYYPILSGALDIEAASLLLAEKWDLFVVEGVGVKCVSDQPWVTAAETAECVIALDGLGMTAEALELFSWIQFMRSQDGAYWTGWVIPDKVHFPGGERTSYTSAAVILAAYALSSDDKCAGLFRI